MWKRMCVGTGVWFLWLTVAGAQMTVPSDSLSVDQAVQLALSHHPVVQRATEKIRAAEANVSLAHVPSYPNLIGSLDYAHLGPVSSFDLPGEGKYNFMPSNEYDLHIGLQQTLFDFNRTGAAVDHARAGVDLATDSLALVKRDLAYQTMRVYYRVLILRENVQVLDDEINALNEHLAVSRKRVETGSATTLDVLNTEVRLASARDEQIDAVSAVQREEIAFRALTGMPSSQPVLISAKLARTSVAVNDDSLLDIAQRQRPELRVLASAKTAAELRRQMAALSDKPTLRLSLLGGFKNGYFPNLNRLEGNYVAGLNLNVPIFDGQRSRREEEVAEAGVNVIQASRADLERRISSEVLQAAAGVRASQDKIDNAQVQVDRADEAVSSAKVQYVAGVITNLDLLDAQTALARARQVYLQALYDQITSLNTLDMATGKQVW